MYIIIFITYILFSGVKTSSIVTTPGVDLQVGEEDSSTPFNFLTTSTNQPYQLPACSNRTDFLTPHRLKCVPNRINSNLIKPQYTSNYPENSVGIANTGNKFRKPYGESICAFGMWALYNKVDYGQRYESETTVIVIRSSDIISCSMNSLPFHYLSQVSSLRYLGHQDVAKDGLNIFTHQNFLGGQWKAFDSAEAPAGNYRLCSIAITGSSAWKICEDSDCKVFVCVDNSHQPGGMFLEADTCSGVLNTPWPRIVRRVERIPNYADDDNEGSVCKEFDAPSVLPTRNVGGIQSVNENDIGEHIEGANGGIFQIKILSPLAN